MKNKFKSKIDINASAASIGISSEDWIDISSYEEKSTALKIMSSNQFDVLPIKEASGDYIHYWKTIIPGKYDDIIKANVVNSKSIYYDTSLVDLLRLFNKNSQAYYFLTDYNDIVGLVSNVNLNSKPVYTFFYVYLSEVEIDLGNWIDSILDEEEILEIITEKSLNSKNTTSVDVLKRYSNEEEENINRRLIEYLYLTQYDSIIRIKKLFSALGYQSANKFGADFSYLTLYRNWFAHPLNYNKIDLKNDLWLVYKSAVAILDRTKMYLPSLIRAYYKTVYQTNDGKFVLKINQKNDAINTYMNSKGYKYYCFITGWNPYSDELSIEENQKRNSWLVNILNKKGKEIFEGKGIPSNDSWKPEDSFLVFGIPKKDVISIGRKFGQNAIVYGEINDNPSLIFIR